MKSPITKVIEHLTMCNSTNSNPIMVATTDSVIKYLQTQLVVEREFAEDLFDAGHDNARSVNDGRDYPEFETYFESNYNAVLLTNSNA